MTGNITRVVENALPRRAADAEPRPWAICMGRPDLETDANPLAPATIVDAFAEALKTVKTEDRIKFAILKELNQALARRHQRDLRRPEQAPRESAGRPRRHPPDDHQSRRPADGRRASVAAEQAAHAAAMAAQQARAGDAGGPGVPDRCPPMRRPRRSASREVDVMSLFRRMFAGQAVARADASTGAPYGQPGMAGDFPQTRHGPRRRSTSRRARCAPTPSGYVPGAPIMATPELDEGLTRLQAGETGFDVGGGTFVQFSGIPQGMHNVLRDLQESPLGKKANQLESMTIELVAMLFDFIFETKDLPDGIKALLARLQIPVLKAAMLDGAFFAKKSHPSRLLVNALAQAGLGWSPVMGQDDPLYKQDRRASSTGSSTTSPTTSRSSTSCARSSRRFSPRRRRPPRRTSRRTAEEINQNDRQEIARGGREGRDRAPHRDVSGAELPRRRSCASSGRHALEHVYLHARRGERGVGPGRHHARGSRLERAAEEDHRGPPASGRAAAVAAEAAVRAACTASAGRRRIASASWRIWSRRMRRR